MEVEITKIKPLTPKQENLLDMHAFLNILNTLSCELQYLGIIFDKDDFLNGSTELCLSLKESLSENSFSFNENMVDEIEGIILSKINSTASGYTGNEVNKIKESVENIHSIFNILNVRTQELMSRKIHEDRWIKTNLKELKQSYYDIFAAFEKNSKGRFGIIYNLEDQKPSDYYININFYAMNAGFIKMPLILQDILRDLLANARKYTKPGGRISSGLSEDTDGIRLVVQDTGMGIPEDEIYKVVNYGQRASNAQNLPTMGGGFGLTKAFLVTKRFNGKMWIKSHSGLGTKIIIEIPKPAAA